MNTPEQPWGIGAILLLDRDNESYRFPHSVPDLPDDFVKQVIEELKPPGYTGTWTGIKARIQAMVFFTNMVKKHHDTGTMPEGDAEPSTQLAGWMMITAHFSKERYWLIVTDDTEGKPSIKFRPVKASSLEEAEQKIDAMIIEIIATKDMDGHTVH